MKLSKEKLTKVIPFCVCKSLANLLLIHTLPFPCSAVHFWELYFLVCSANWILVDLANVRHWQNPGGVKVFFFFFPAFISTLDPTFTVILLHWSNPSSLHARSSNRRVPTWVLVPQLWSSSLNSERNAFSLCPFKLGVVVTSYYF